MATVSYFNEKAKCAVKLAKATGPNMVPVCCPCLDCDWIACMERTRGHGIPRTLSCPECNAQFCTGCYDILDYIDDVGVHLSACALRTAHKPLPEPININDPRQRGLSLQRQHWRGTTDDLSQWNALSYAQQHYLLRAFEETFEEIYQRAVTRRCPLCHKTVVKDDQCTRMLCYNHGATPLVWCYCCERILPTSRTQQNWLIESGVVKDRDEIVVEYAEITEEQTAEEDLYSQESGGDSIFTYAHNRNWFHEDPAWPDEWNWKPDSPKDSLACPLFLHQLPKFCVQTLTARVHVPQAVLDLAKYWYVGQSSDTSATDVLVQDALSVYRLKLALDYHCGDEPETLGRERLEVLLRHGSPHVQQILRTLDFA